MSEFTITKQQKAFFGAFGFLVFRGLMKDRIAEITDEFEYVFKKHGGNYNGKEHNFVNSSVIVSFIGHSEKLASLLDDPKIHEILTSLLGDDYNYLTSSGNKLVGNSGWHSDTPMDKPWPGYLKSLNLSFYLDPVVRETGALRVIPGSHFIGDQFTERLKESFKEQNLMDLWGVANDEVPSITIDARPGDLLVFNNYMKHCAYGGGNNRRLMLLNFSKRFPDERLDELQQYVSTFANFWVDELHGDAVLRNGGEERMRHLRQIQENQGHLPELSRKARELFDSKQRTM